MHLLFPGSFDPPHLGHLDLVRRAAALATVTVAVAIHPDKAGMLPVERRVALLQELTAHLPGVTVASYRGATVHFAATIHATALLRGLRQGQDLEAERPLAIINRRHGIDTLFLYTDPAYLHISSSTVRAARAAGLPVHDLVPPAVEAALACA